MSPGTIKYWRSSLSKICLIHLSQSWSILDVCDPPELLCNANLPHSDGRQPAASKKAGSPGQQGEGALVCRFQPRHSAYRCIGRCFLVTVLKESWFKNLNHLQLNGFCFFPAFSVALVHLLRSIWCLGERLDTWSTQTNRWFFEQLDTVLAFWLLLASNHINLPQCADEAMSVLNGRMVNGVRMKVMLADPPREESHKRLRTYWGHRRVSFLLQETLVCF